MEIVVPNAQKPAACNSLPRG